ncbi:hypothetical protein DFH28DRAFT_1019812 [Melampsora americana]|nr:hypothetical protein DFH28DRAFT_1019812 [Melampsora americana]
MASEINESEIKTGKRKLISKVTLLDLPRNVILRIIEHVASYAEREHCRLTVNRAMNPLGFMAKEISAICMRTPNETLSNDPEPSMISYYLCYLQLQRDPLLDSAASLSSVSKYLYELCAPILWKKLMFPTRFPISMTLWTQDILPKHGYLVRHISFTLGETFGSRNSSYPSEYENTLIYKADDRQQIITRRDVNCYGRFLGLSPSTLARVFELCPYINSIKLRCPTVSAMGGSSQRGFIHEISLQLNRIIPRCSQLTKLSILFQDGMQLPITLISSLLDQLPALSSFSCIGSFVGSDRRMLSEDERTQSGFALGNSISKLEHLTQLHLYDTDFEFQTWTQVVWPATITELTLMRCVGFYGFKIHDFLQHIAPRLITLTLQFGGERCCSSVFCPKETVCAVPELTQLTLYADERYPQLIKTFQECRALKQIIYRNLDQSDWDHLPYLISYWPKLEELELTSSDSFIESLRHHENHLEHKVKEACLASESNISLVIKDPPLKGSVS